jgi:hypothetical protein
MSRVARDDRYDQIDYSPHPDSSFNVWVELGARDPDQQSMLDDSPYTEHTIKVKSSSPEAEDLIHEPLEYMLRDGIPGVTKSSRVTSIINHHERGMRYRIIRATAKVEKSSGDVLLTYDKETW